MFRLYLTVIAVRMSVQPLTSEKGRLAMRLRDKITQRMTELAGDETSAWTAIESRYGATLRRTWIKETPDWARPDYDYGSYQVHVFLTLVAGKFILGVAPAPWVGRRDSEVPLWLAEAILEDPELGLDYLRQLNMRDARKAARSGS